MKNISIKLISYLLMALLLATLMPIESLRYSRKTASSRKYKRYNRNKKKKTYSRRKRYNRKIIGDKVKSKDAAEIGFDEESYSTKKKIRITDGIGKGRSKEIALQNAIRDAREKAKVRVTSTFRHILSRSKNGQFIDKSVAQEVHAKVIDKERILSVKYHDEFSPYYVAIVDCYITVSFLDLDFFATEIMKTAEAACIRSIILAGWGQFFNRNYFAGVTMGLITYGSLGYGFYRESKIAGAKRNLQAATNSKDSEKYYNILNEHSQVSRIMYTVGVLTWAYSIWEAFEDRERSDEVLDKVKQMYFPKFPHKRVLSPIQGAVIEGTRPDW